MNRCPITYKLCDDRRYSEKGLKFLSRSLKDLSDFPYTPKEQIQLASMHAAKMSIQGVQPKLSVILNAAKETFDIVDKGGRFILKPPHLTYDELPQNEDLTMRLASAVDIEVPFHGMIYNIDSSLSYFIKRFDRLSRGQKVATEDFSQLLGYSRDTKYESSMEKVVSVIDKHCTFPILERIKLYRRVMFNYLVGNEDMHLKNFTLIRRGNKVELSPAYDFLNTTIPLKSTEQIALPIRGKKSRLTYADLVDYFGGERLGLSAPILNEELTRFQKAIDEWKKLIAISFLSSEFQASYIELILRRLEILFH